MTKLTLNSAFGSVKNWRWVGVAIVAIGAVLIYSYAEKKMKENAD